MIVYIVALAEAAFYLLAVPVHLAVRLDGLTAGAGVALFDGRAALRKAGTRREKAGGGPGLRAVWPVLRRLRFERVELTGRVSLGDAAATALACGLLNGAGRCLAARADALRIEVTPVFSDAPRLELRGMLRARAAQIILAVIRSRKGRILSWTSIPSRAS